MSVYNVIKRDKSAKQTLGAAVGAEMKETSEAKNGLQKFYIQSSTEGSKKMYVLLPTDFDFGIYRDLNEDLSDMDDEQLARHYVNYGKKEKRAYAYTVPADFDLLSYKLLNADLSHMSEKELIHHWALWGCHEHRKYKMVNYCEARNSLFAAKNIKRENNLQWSYMDFSNEDSPTSVQDKLCKKCLLNGGHPGLRRSRSVLVIDYDESFTGGTSFFYDVLSQHYQKVMGVKMIRVRCNKEQMHIYVNDFRMVGVSTDDQVRLFIKSHLENIYHIFINSIVGHKMEFVKYILNLPVKKSAFTHDYSIIFEYNQPTFRQISEANSFQIRNHIIDSVDTIYTQNIENINIMTRIPGISQSTRSAIEKKAVVIQMPDYYATEPDTFECATTNFTFGIIGNISDLKGISLMLEILNHYREQKHVRFFNFGENHIGVPSQKYSNIPQLNSLIDTVKPNALLFLALWPETFSYTLTLSLLTEIPLYVFDIGMCVVTNRLEHWQSTKNVYLFSHVSQLAETVSITDHNVVKYRHIKNKVRISNEMDKVFLGNDLDGGSPDVTPVRKFYFENVCLVTSKVQVTDVKYNYSQRSKYTTDERLLQTIETVQSVRMKIPDVFIILIDHSDLKTDLWNDLIQSVDLFISDSNQIMRWNCDLNKFKIYGELYQTIFANRAITSSGLSFKNFFKISGRYLLNEHFCYEKFNNNDNIFKQNHNIKNRLYYYTSFYKIARDSFYNFCTKLEQVYKDIMLYETCADFETVVPLLVDKKDTDTLGLTQFISCDVAYEMHI